MKPLRILAFSLLFLLPNIGPAAAVERILLFVSDVTVERNGDLAVTETIRVEAEGREIRRGILRDFPTIYTRADGARVEVGFSVQSVTRDGATENWSTENISNGVRIRIGSSDVTLTNGRHDYVIRYRTTRQIGFFSDYDELYWNATGTGWTFAIDQAEARITLPAEVPFRQSAFYTGPQGAQGKDATIVEQRPGRIVFRTTRPLPAHSGLTVAAGWEKGLIVEPTPAQRAGYFLQDNLAILLSVAGLVLILGYYALAWMLVGRDPPAGTIIPLFGPPAGMSPAATRFVDRMGFDDRCFAVSIIDLGVKGHLKIVSEGSNKPVIEQRAKGGAIASEESAMESKLFGSASSLMLDQSNHETLGKAKEALKANLKRSYVGTMFKNNYGWSGFGFVITVLLSFAVVIAVAATKRDDLFGGMLFSTIFGVPMAMLGAAMIFSGWQRTLGGGGLVVGGFVLVGLALVGGLFAISYNGGGIADMVPPLALFAAAAVSGLAFYWLKRPSPPGRKVMDEIEGFRQYLGIAEEDRLNALNPPDKTPELFERFLPYAVALDVQNAWAKRFASVLAAAGAAAYANSWYTGDRRWGDDPVAFADHLSGELATTIASASTAPGSSSGSSGGGSSGGGGGGGGGSGW